MFKLLGILVALYVVHAVATGQVYAKRGLWGTMCKRSERPLYYWTVVTVYGGLSVALFLVF